MSITTLCRMSVAATTVFWALGGALADDKVSANANREPVEGKEEKVTTLALAVAAFREAAIQDPGKAMEVFGSPEARRKWQVKVSADMIVQQQTDFFTGGIMLSGSTSGRESCVGLYNPWWDAILLLKMAASQTAVGRAQVADFIFMSGETFRGETVSTNEISCLTVVPEKNPISVELWRVASGTRKRFMELFPLDGDADWRAVSLMALRMDWTKELVIIQARALLRMRHSIGLLKNARDTGIAAFLTRLARNGTRFQLYNYFGKKECHPLLNTFSEIPKEFRRDFIPYGYVPTQGGTLFVLVNKKTPRLYITITLASDIKADTSGMEWYDLSQADELLGAWNDRKEVGK